MIYNPRKTALLFDLDGTLIDSNLKLANDIISTLARLGTIINEDDFYAHEDWVDLARSHGHSKQDFFTEFNNRETWEESLAKGMVNIYDDTIPVLDELKSEGYRIGLTTRSDDHCTHAKLLHFGLHKYFSSIQITNPRRSDAPSKINEVEKAIEDLLITKEDGYRDLSNIEKVYMIGDSEQDDIGTADELKQSVAQAGWRILVESVYTNRTGIPLKRLKADHEIRDLYQLMKILRGGSQ